MASTLEDIKLQLAEQVRKACADSTPLEIKGAGSKDFYGHPVNGEKLDVSAYRGILSYEPSELVITAAAGTPLSEVEAVLSEQRQFLPFEPPDFNGQSTLGGAVASGLSGPRRPWTGPVRDFILGITCINGRGEVLKFGGQVIKNVAGYDLSRLLTGSNGTLAVILEISIKVIPKPEVEVGLAEEMSLEKAREMIHTWSVRPVPLSGACYEHGILRLRLSGYDAAVSKTARNMGLQQVESTRFWEDLRHQQLEFFHRQGLLWRISIPPVSAELDCPGDCLIDWGGALYWLRSEEAGESVRQRAGDLGGHATLYQAGGLDMPRFHPLPEGMSALHRRIKEAFDPSGILNPGRMYPQG